MMPINLTLSAFGPYPNQININFESFQEDGLFLITGPTGSGKTMIFDEIDVGISGRTAQKVSEKMAVIGRCHQVLCITHLPQIAAMADTHFEIEKHVEGTETITQIHPLEGEESVRELARLLGGAEITPAVLGNAREMKELAQQQKNTRLK